MGRKGGVRIRVTGPYCWCFDTALLVIVLFDVDHVFETICVLGA